MLMFVFVYTYYQTILWNSVEENFFLQHLFIYIVFIRQLYVNLFIVCFQLNVHCMKSVRIWSYSDPHLPVFGPE